MEADQLLTEMKGIFRNQFPKKDKRCKIQVPELLAAFVCSICQQDGRTKSLGGLRKAVGDLTQQLLSRAAFWERMASKRLQKQLLFLVKDLIKKIRVSLKIGSNINKKLGVRGIQILDSSSFSLNDQAADRFPGPRKNVIPASMKHHVLFHLFSGSIEWFDLTPAIVHDRKSFPPIKLLKGSLIIFDLGYWDFQLFKDMIDENVKFLSRIKSNATIIIAATDDKNLKKSIGFKLHSGIFNSFQKEIVEFTGEIKISKTKETFRTRVIGFWCDQDRCYHWYMTNLTVEAKMIDPLYRLRWQ